MNERRSDTRKRTFLPAKIRTVGGVVSDILLISDQAENGAKIVGKNANLLPKYFDVILEDSSERRATVRWRKPDAIGVEFDELVNTIDATENSMKISMLEKENESLRRQAGLLAQRLKQFEDTEQSSY